MIFVYSSVDVPSDVYSTCCLFIVHAVCLQYMLFTVHAVCLQYKMFVYSTCLFTVYIFCLFYST